MSPTPLSSRSACSTAQRSAGPSTRPGSSRSRSLLPTTMTHQPDNAPARCNVRAAATTFCNADRELARGWPARARDNIAAIRLSKELEAAGRAPTAGGAGAPAALHRLRRDRAGAELLSAAGRRRSSAPGWEEIGRDLADAVTPARIRRPAARDAIRPLHAGADHPRALAGRRSISASPAAACSSRAWAPACSSRCCRRRCATPAASPASNTTRSPPASPGCIHPEARVRCEDYTRSPLGGGFDLAIGNPPFADRIVRADPTTAALGLRLHDYFIARSIARLRPGGLALFVTSTGTMDKASTAAREHIASMADLIGAVRLPEGSMRATAGTDVVIDVLVFQRRAEGQAAGRPAWMDLREIAARPQCRRRSRRARSDRRPKPRADVAAGCRRTRASARLRRGVVRGQRVFRRRTPRWCSARTRQRRGIYGPGLSYTCRARRRRPARWKRSSTPPWRACPPASSRPSADALRRRRPRTTTPPSAPARAADGATIKEGSYLIGKAGRLMQIVGGAAVPVADQGRARPARASAARRPRSSARCCRSATPCATCCAPRPPTSPGRRRRSSCASPTPTSSATSGRSTTPSSPSLTDPETGEERETHRRPNLAPFADDPDCWLVASIEDYDLDSGLARMGPIFRERVDRAAGDAADHLAPPTRSRSR